MNQRLQDTVQKARAEEQANAKAHLQKVINGYTDQVSGLQDNITALQQQIEELKMTINERD